MPFPTMFTRILSALPLILACSSAGAQTRIFTAADQVRLATPGAPRIAPDGRHIAYTLRQADLSTSAWITQVWLVTVSDRSVRRMTSSTGNASAPDWSPDGSMLSFVSARDFQDDSLRGHGGTPQLFALPLAGGEAMPLTDLPNGVDEYAWSPDGQWIAVLSEADPAPRKGPDAATRARMKMDWISTADPLPGKDIWIVDVRTRAVRLLATLDRGVCEMSWSPDNARILYQSNITGEYNDDQKHDLWSIGLDGRRERLTATPGPETRARCSPDGRSIAFITQTVPDIEFAKTELSIMDPVGGHRRSLTAAFPYSVQEFAWRPDGKSLLALVNERASASLYEVDPVSGACARLTEPDLVVSEMSAGPGGLACVGETAAGTKEICLSRNGVTSVLTRYSEQLAGFRPGGQELIGVRSRDGKYVIDAVLVTPPDFTTKRRWPLVLAYHGGPYGDFDNKFVQSYPTRLLAQQGIVTVMPNIRGSSGGTDEFGQSNRYDLGGADFDDAMDVVDTLIARGIADPDRLGVIGGSYGGYMVNWTISRTARFKAAVSMYGIFSWHTDWSNSWQPSFEQMYFGYNYWDRPPDMNNLWIGRAPQTFAKNIVTPTLILHGTEDKYTNIANSREMYQALHELGRPVEFVTYPRAEHGLKTEPNQYIDVLDRSAAWLKKYIAPD